MAKEAQPKRLDWSKLDEGDWAQLNVLLDKLFADADEMFQILFDNQPDDAEEQDGFLVNQVFN